MTSRDQEPAVLPGISARTWTTAMGVLLWVSLVAFIPVVASSMFGFGGANYFDWFIPVFVDYGLVYVCILFSWMRAKKETAAGYTSQWRGHPTLPQLDTATGAIIRRAGEAYVKKSDWKRGTHQAGLPTTNVVHPTLWQRALPSLPQIIVTFAAIVAAGLFGSIARGFGPVVGGSFAGGLFLLVVVSNLIAGLVARSRLERLRMVALDDFVFLVGSSSSFRIQAITLDWHGNIDARPRYRGVSATSSGLTFWQGKPPVAAATLPWSRVLSVQDDVISIGNTSLPSVLISYKDDADDVQTLPLVNANADWLRFRNKVEVRWIASELNQLRTTTTTARLI